MKKSVAAISVAALLGLGYFAAGSTAHAADYPDQPLTVSAPGTVTSGSTFTAKCEVEGGNEYFFEYEGDEKSDEGDTGAVTFKAPKVSEETDTTLTCEAETDEAPVAASVADIAVPMARVGPTSQTITVVPRGSDDDDDDDSDNGSDNASGSGGLPDTGAGNTIPLLIVGGVLFAAGGAAVVTARRRQTA